MLFRSKVVRQAEVDELRRFIKPGDVVIDVGAHSGDTAIPMALAAGREGCVLALEPNPYVFPVLEKNAELNPDKTHIVALSFAATDRSDDFYFHYSDAGFCNGGLHAGVSRWRHGHAYRLKVRGENLQTYIAERFADLESRIRFVKVDAEGYDYEVLASLNDLIVRQRPFIKTEVFTFLSRERRERLYDFVVQLGYRVFLIHDEAHYLGGRFERADVMKHSRADLFCVPAT